MLIIGAICFLLITVCFTAYQIYSTFQNSPSQESRPAAQTQFQSQSQNQPQLQTKTITPANPEWTKPADLPDAHRSDWDLILVNRENIKPELNPPLATVAGKEVNAKIATQVAAFLAAAQKIDPAEHLISGYRSVAYQEQLFDSYVDQEMKGRGTVNQTGQPISAEEAVKDVETYSQPPGSSEHQTGLAIDMSTVDSLNASDPAVVAQIVKIAPQYGFVQRFKANYTPWTGVGAEDWHFRYVGVANATYMTKHDLSLEEYLTLLPA